VGPLQTTSWILFTASYIAGTHPDSQKDNCLQLPFSTWAVWSTVTLYVQGHRIWQTTAELRSNKVMAWWWPEL